MTSLQELELELQTSRNFFTNEINNSRQIEIDLLEMIEILIEAGAIPSMEMVQELMLKAGTARVMVLTTSSVISMASWRSSPFC